MSVLSSTRGDPELLYAVLRLLIAIGEPVEQNELRDWIQPGLTKLSGSLLGDTLGVARSLGLVSYEDKGLVPTVEGPLDSITQLADLVHTRLSTCSDDGPDQVLYQTFAWFVIKCEENGQTTAWVDQYSRRSELTDEIDKVLREVRTDAETRLFNDSKYSSWSNWMHFTGLACDLGRSFAFFPFAYERVKRELTRLSGVLGLEQQLDAEDVLKAISSAMPYLDRGRIFEAVSRGMKWQQPQQRLSLVLSTALRELHDLGEIELIAKSDMSDGLRLSDDPLSKVSHVRWITLRKELVN